MNKDFQEVRKRSDGLQVDEDLVCNVCGRYGAYQLGDRELCLECYTSSGSCCPEFGKDDPWTVADKD